MNQMVRTWCATEFLLTQGLFCIPPSTDWVDEQLFIFKSKKTQHHCKLTPQFTCFWNMKPIRESGFTLWSRCCGDRASRSPDRWAGRASCSPRPQSFAVRHPESPALCGKGAPRCRRRESRPARWWWYASGPYGGERHSGNVQTGNTFLYIYKQTLSSPNLKICLQAQTYGLSLCIMHQ